MDGSVKKKDRIDVVGFLKKTGTSRHRFAIAADLNPATVNRYINGDTYSGETERKIQEAIENTRRALAESVALVQTIQGHPRPKPTLPVDNGREISQAESAPVVVSVARVAGDSHRRHLYFIRDGAILFTYPVDKSQALALAEICRDIADSLA